jgi:hypothetical protein
MKLATQALVFLLFALPAFTCCADERWYWASAECSDEASEDVYMFVAVVDIQPDGSDGADEARVSENNARFGFGGYAEANYAEEYCGTAEITAQNTSVSGSFDSREEAAESLDAYVQKEEAEGNAWLKIVRLEDYVDE